MEDLLKLELRLLILRHGRKAVLETLAALDEQTPERVEADLKLAEQRNRGPKKKRKIVSASESAAQISQERPEAAELLRILATRYDNRVFLPQLRDVQRFLDRAGAPHRSLRSRGEAARLVVAALSRLGGDDLKRLAQEASSLRKESDYALLAREIIGTPAVKREPPDGQT
jgi:hypothetical protein